MLNRISLVGFSFLLLSCMSDNSTQAVQGKELQEEKQLVEVVDQLKFEMLMLDKTAQLIDVRTESEYAGGHIGEALNIDYYLDDFKAQLSKLDRKKPVLVYCQSGGRSGKAAAELNSMGFKAVYDLKGGYGNYSK
jgi:rhodanese-related sulfurtransferase